MIATHQNTKEELQDPYNSNLFCERLVMPFVLARYRLQHPSLQEDLHGPEPTEARSLQDLDEAYTLTHNKENIIPPKPVVRSLNSLTPKNRSNAESIIEAVRRRLSIKDESKKQMTFTQVFRKPSDNTVTSTKYGVSTQVQANQPRSLTTLVKTTPKSFVMKHSRASVPNTRAQKNLRTHVRVNSLPTSSSVKLETGENKDQDGPTIQKSSKEYLIKTVRFSLKTDQQIIKI